MTTVAEAAVGVCGFGRSGSSMLMAMLDAGGVPPVAGSAERSYEIADPYLLLTTPAADLDDRAVKLLDFALYSHPKNWPPVEWRFIWCHRNPREQARSIVKFLCGLVGVPLQPGDADRLAASFDADRIRALDLLAKSGRLLEVSYDDTLNDPIATAAAIAVFLRPRFIFDSVRAARVVHQRSPECRPDLAWELTGAVDS